MPTIRPFTEADYAAAKQLWESTPGVGLSSADEAEPIAQFLRRNEGLSFVAEHQGAIVGTILCGHDGRRGLIHHLVTAPTIRRLGIGKALLEQGLRALRAQGIQKCHLLVFQNNTDGLEFWRAVHAEERRELALFSMNTEAL